MSKTPSYHDTGKIKFKMPATHEAGKVRPIPEVSGKKTVASKKSTSAKKVVRKGNKS